ncbi:MAG: exodeoxyribonuclease V subunit gamma [bacterium]|nr:exodeoxyribonuclease V subunit gamma [bacterium]
MTKPSLSFFTSNRLEVLVEQLARTLASEPLPPLEREVIVVQSQGMHRWLTLRLADRLGVAASLIMPFPGHFCHYLAEHLLDDGTAWPAALDLGSPPPSLFRRGLLTWRLFARLGGDRQDGSPAAVYLEDDPDQVKRYQLSARLAGLFDDYQLYRPREVLGWEAGQLDAAGDEAAWQADLWRSLTENIDEDHLARRFERLIEHLQRLPGQVKGLEGLPSRLSVFGVSTLPPIFVELLAALSRLVPVAIYFTSPTYQYWGDIRSEREAVRIRRRLHTDRRAPGDDHLESGNDLLAGLGRQGREFFDLLQDADTEGAAWHDLDFVEPGGGCLLHAVQSDVLHLVDRGGPDAPPRPLAAGDDSLSVHACHSRTREMEVLRDRLLDAFGRDPALTPGDVLVMVPDIGEYSPYVEAVFGVEWQGTPPLPFAIADRRSGQQRPPAETVLDLLDLVSSRVTPRSVFDLLDVPAVHRAAGIAAGETPLLRQWIRDTRVRWGMDGAQRRSDFDLPDDDANTWRAGLDRLLMGYAAGDVDELVGGVVPHSGATAGNVELLGRLAAFMDNLFFHLRALRAPRPADAWAADLAAALESLYEAEGEGEEHALELVRDAFADLALAKELAGVTERISLRVVREHLARRLEAEGFGTGFISGRITFCALKPMRSIPFKVICVAGLAEGAFPRRDARRSFDLIAARPRRGDRSLREDDRYLFLETLLSAGDRLILTYEGRSQKDNRRKAPAVVVSELLDYLDRAFVTGDGHPVREQVVVEHRLHPFSPDYYGAGGDPRLFSYSRENHQASRNVGTRRAAAPFIATDQEDQTGEEAAGPLEIELSELTEMWVHPTKHYCRRVLQLTLALETGDVDEAEPFAVDFLDRYRISQWLLDRRLSGAEPGDEELELLRRRGELPHAGLGAAHHARLEREVEGFVATLPRAHSREPILVELAGDGWRLQGRLDDLTDAGVLRFRCATLKPKDQLRAWVAHVARNVWEAGHPTGLPPTTHVIGRNRGIRFGALGNARELLDALVAGYREGLRRPLPVFERASHAFVEQQRKLADGHAKMSPADAARRAFDGDRFPGDAADPYVALCFRDRDPLAEDDFATWAETLWRPILERAEEIEP